MNGLFYWGCVFIGVKYLNPELREGGYVVSHTEHCPVFPLLALRQHNTDSHW